MDLRSWRRLNGFTQKQVAAVIGVDSTMISQYERKLAKPTLFHLAIIHTLTDRQVTVEDFLYGDEGSKVRSVDYPSSKNSIQSYPGSTGA